MEQVEEKGSVEVENRGIIADFETQKNVKEKVVLRLRNQNNKNWGRRTQNCDLYAETLSARQPTHQ